MICLCLSLRNTLYFRQPWYCLALVYLNHYRLSFNNYVNRKQVTLSAGLSVTSGTAAAIKESKSHLPSDSSSTCSKTFMQISDQASMTHRAALNTFKQYVPKIPSQITAKIQGQVLLHNKKRITFL